MIFGLEWECDFMISKDMPTGHNDLLARAAFLGLPGAARLQHLDGFASRMRRKWAAPAAYEASPIQACSSRKLSWGFGYAKSNYFDFMFRAIRWWPWGGAQVVFLGRCARRGRGQRPALLQGEGVWPGGVARGVPEAVPIACLWRRSCLAENRT